MKILKYGLFRFNRRWYLIVALGLCFLQKSHAQHHQNTWLRSTLGITLGPRVELDAEFQHRRQNGLENENRLDKKLMFSYRGWIHYKLNKDVKFSLSPFAYFSNYKIIEKPLDHIKLPNSEIRFSVAVDLQHELSRKLAIVDRTAAEYRIFENRSNLSRLRNRLGIRYELSEKLNFGLYDELLFNISGTSVDHFFDQDRIGFGLTYQLLTHLKVETGLMHISRLPISSDSKLQENNVLLHLTYQVR